MSAQQPSLPVSAAQLATLSWSEYCDAVRLQELLTTGANACYASKTPRPEAYLARMFAQNTAADVVASVQSSEVVDGYGGFTAALEIQLTSGRRIRQLVSHTPMLITHPSASRVLSVGSVPLRAQTPAQVMSPSPTGNPKDAAAAKGNNKGAASALGGAAAAVSLVTPQQRFDTVCSVVAKHVAPQLVGTSVVDQLQCDAVIISSDGTANVSKLLATTAASMSLALAKLGAEVLQRPLYQHVAALHGAVPRPVVPGVPMHLKSHVFHVPRPIVTIFATEPRYMGRLRIREVGLVPVLTQPTTSSAAAAVYAADGGSGAVLPNAAFPPKIVAQLASLYDVLLAKLDDPPTNADGSIKYNGYESLAQALDLIEEALKDPSCGGLQLGVDVQAAVVFDGGLCYRPESLKYQFLEGGVDLTGAQLAEQVAQFVRDKRCVCYVEDVLHDGDHVEMKRLMHRIGGQTAVAGSSTLGGDVAVIQRAATEMHVNTMVVRLSDHGTLTKATQHASRFLAQYPGSTLAVTTDSSESDGASLADLAVAVGARFVKVGGLLRQPHADALNRLVAIQQSLEANNVLIPPPAWETLPIALPPAPVEAVAELNPKDAKKKK